MVKCSILGCVSNTSRKDDKVIFFQFPKDKRIRFQWIKATGRREWQPGKDARICSKHFKPRSMRKRKKRVLLSRGSIPSILLHAGSKKSKDISKGPSKDLHSFKEHQPFKVKTEPIFIDDDTASSATLSCPSPLSDCSIKIEIEEEMDFLKKLKAKYLARGDSDDFHAHDESNMDFSIPQESSYIVTCTHCSAISNNMFRYFCASCKSSALCDGCVSDGAHGACYVLRAPPHSSQTEVEAVLRAIHEVLVYNKQKESTSDEMKMELNTEVEAEEELQDPLSNSPINKSVTSPKLSDRQAEPDSSIESQIPSSIIKTKTSKVPDEKPENHIITNNKQCTVKSSSLRLETIDKTMKIPEPMQGSAVFTKNKQMSVRSSFLRPETTAKTMIIPEPIQGSTVFTRNKQMTVKSSSLRLETIDKTMKVPETMHKNPLFTKNKQMTVSSSSLRPEITAKTMKAPDPIQGNTVFTKNKQMTVRSSSLRPETKPKTMKPPDPMQGNTIFNQNKQCTGKSSENLPETATKTALSENYGTLCKRVVRGNEMNYYKVLSGPEASKRPVTILNSFSLTSGPQPSKTPLMLSVDCMDSNLCKITVDRKQTQHIDYNCDIQSGTPQKQLKYLPKIVSSDSGRRPSLLVDGLNVPPKVVSIDSVIPKLVNGRITL